MFVSLSARRLLILAVSIVLLMLLVACGTAEPAAPVEVVKEVVVENEVVREVTVIQEVEVEVIKEVTVEVPVTVEVVKEMQTFIGDHHTSPAFPPYDHDLLVGESKLWRSADSIHTEFHASDLPPNHAMTLWFIIFNHPEKCAGGPFKCSPADFGADADTMGDMVYIPGAGAVVGDDGTVSLSGSVSMGDTSGSGLAEMPSWCQADGCGEPVGLVNPDGALIIVALHSHGPASDDADTLALQMSTYLGGCDTFSGSLPAGLAGSPDEIPAADGECATILESPHPPAMPEETMDEPAMEMISSEAPAFPPYDHDEHVGASTLVRSADTISTEYTASGLTPNHAMTLWFIIFNHPEKCAGGPFKCSPADFGANTDTMGDMIYIPGAGAVVGDDGTVSLSGSVSMGDTSGSGLAEMPSWCQEDGCGEPVGLVNPDGALIIVALHSHGPASDDADTLALQMSTYLGGCDSFSGTLPAGLAGSVDEVPSEAGECATILESPHPPAN